MLSTAHNYYGRSHPIQARFAKQAKEPERIYLHAEIAALIRLKKGQHPYKMTIERVKKDGSMGLAAPCAVCQAAIMFYGVERVEYSL